jgi:hypothetical protein
VAVGSEGRKKKLAERSGAARSGVAGKAPTDFVFMRPTGPSLVNLRGWPSPTAARTRIDPIRRCPPVSLRNVSRSVKQLTFEQKFFAGSNAGGRRAAALYSLNESAKLYGLNPQDYLSDISARIADHPARGIVGRTGSPPTSAPPLPDSTPSSRSAHHALTTTVENVRTGTRASFSGSRFVLWRSPVLR